MSLFRLSVVGKKTPKIRVSEEEEKRRRRRRKERKRKRRSR